MKRMPVYKGFYTNKKIPILRDGKQWRPMVHVKDTSKAMMTIMKSSNGIKASTVLTRKSINGLMKSKARWIKSSMSISGLIVNMTPRKAL